MSTTFTRGNAALLLATHELRRHSVITEQEIRGLRRRWSHRWTPRQADGTRPDISQELDQLRECLPMRVTEGQAQVGLRWWQLKLWTATGEPRNTAFLRDCEDYLPGSVHTMRHTIKTFTHFSLDDFYFEGRGVRVTAYPVYSAHGRDGRSFSYAARPWQSGGVVILS